MARSIGPSKIPRSMSKRGHIGKQELSKRKTHKRKINLMSEFKREELEMRLLEAESGRMRRSEKKRSQKPAIRTQAPAKKLPFLKIGQKKDYLPHLADPLQAFDHACRGVHCMGASQEVVEVPAVPTVPAVPKTDTSTPTGAGDILEMSQRDVLSRLRHSMARPDVPEGFLEELSGNMQVSRYKAEEFVLRKGCTNTSLHWILQGSARLTMLSKAGEEVHGELGEGGLFGEPNFFVKGRWEVDVVARSELVVGGLTRERLARIFEKFPEFLVRLVVEVQRKWVVNGCRHIDIAHRFMCSLALFRRVPQGVLRKLARKAVFRAYRPHEYIIRRGDVGRDVFFIVTGIAEAFYGRETDTRHADMLARPISRLGPGQHVGEIEYLCFPPGSRPQRLESIRTVTASEVLKVCAANLDAILSSFPEAYEDLKYFAFQRSGLVKNMMKNGGSGGGSECSGSAYPCTYPHPMALISKRKCAGPPEKLLVSNRVFPECVMVKIFARLDLSDLVRCIRVSKHWNRLIRSSERLFNVLDFRPLARVLDDKTFVSVARLAGNRPCAIDLSGCYHITDRSFYPAMRTMAQGGNLERLSLCDNWNLSPCALMDLCASACGKVRQLDLGNCAGVTDKVVSQIISHCPLLEDLNLSYCKRVTDKTMLRLAKWRNPHLSKLKLARCSAITNLGYCDWCAAWFPNVREIVLRDCASITDSALSAVAAACRNLTSLDLTFCCNLSQDALPILSYFCKNLSDLNLSFCGNAVSDKSLVHVFSMRHLTNLTLTGCAQVTREGVYLLASNSRSLRTLGVGQCPLIDMYRGEAQPALMSYRDGEKCAYLTGAADQCICITGRLQLGTRS